MDDDPKRNRRIIAIAFRLPFERGDCSGGAMSARPVINERLGIDAWREGDARLRPRGYADLFWVMAAAQFKWRESLRDI